MNKAFLSAFFIFTFFAFSLSFAQSGWMLQNPLPSPHNYSDIKFFDAQTGLAVTFSLNGLNRTTNGGDNWQQVFIDSTYKTLQLSIINSSTGWITTLQGPIKKTTDAGASWVTVNPAFYGTLFFCDVNTGYSLQNNEVFKTTNSGTNWQQTGLTSIYGFTNIQFFNANTGIVTSAANIYKTTNGGISWSILHYGITSIFYYMNFINESTGFLYNSEKRIFKTTNGGLNWDSSFIPARRLKTINFVDNLNGFAAGDSGYVYKTTNCGVSWFLLQSNSTLWLNTICFIDLNKGFIGADAGVLLKTSNGGNNWTGRYNPTYTALNSIDFVDELTGWAVGEMGTLVKTTNGGINWNAINVNSTKKLGGIKFINSFTGFMVSDSVIYKSTNGGINWTSAANKKMDYFDSKFQFLNPNTGWVTGYDSLYKTTNGGNNWFGISKFQIGNFADFHFFNELTGIGTNGNIFKTTNGGVNWLRVYDAVINFTSSGLSFINAQTGFAAFGSMNALYKTTDAGDNWQQIIYYEPWTISRSNDLKFFNENTGIVCTSEGYIYKTTNSGINWFAQFYEPGGITLISCKFINNNTGWVAGYNGTIYKTTTGGNVFVTQISSEIPDNHSLSQNYPNPFNPSTKINYELKITNYVSLKVFDLLGKEVASLVNEKQSAGSYAVDFNSAEYNLPSGIYFYTFSTGDFKETRKMVLIK